MSRRTKAQLGRGRKIMPWLAIAAVSLFALPLPVFAEGTAAKFFREVLFEWIISPFVLILNYLLLLLVDVAQYNSFASAEIVEKGWVVLRDLSNMFFVLILLIIAISSIVKWQKVNYRQNLRRLILMAILINFSKTIVVFFIDLSQVITLTFITAVKDILQAGVLTALGLDKAINPVAEGGVKGFAGDVFTYVVAALMVVISCIVVAAILMIFLIRIIALWLAIVFSPLAFLASTLPQTEKWYNKWWETFVANLTVAPALAFMLWLTFAVIAGRGGQPILVGGGTGGTPLVSTNVGGIASSTLVGFLVSIGLLLYSIRLAVQMGAAGASAAQTFSNRMQGYVKGVGKRLAVGRSGAGGALGLARAGVAAAIAHPGDALRGVGRFGVRLADVGTLGLGRLAGKLPVRFGATPQAGAGKLGRAAAAITPQFAETGALGSQVSGVAARAGEKYEAGMTAARRKFEAAEGFIPRQIRKVQARFDVGEGERQRERTTTAAKAMNTPAMDYRQLKDVLQSKIRFYDADRVAASREMLTRNKGEMMDRLQTEDPNLKREAMDLILNSSGLTPDEQRSIKENTLRHNDLKSEEILDLIKNMHSEGKSFSRRDQMDKKAGALIAKLGHQTLTGAEFKKYVDRIPKEAQKYAAQGLEERISELGTKERTEFPGGEGGKKQYDTHVKQVQNDREDIRQALVKLNPNDVEIYSHDLVVKDGKVVFDGTEVTAEGKKVPTRDLNPNEEKTRKRMMKSMGVKQIGSMKPETLRSNGHLMEAGDIIKAGGHEDVTGLQSQSIMEGVAVNIDIKDSQQLETFEAVWRNNIEGGKLRTAIEEVLDRAKSADATEEEKKDADKVLKTAKKLDEILRENKGGKKLGPDKLRERMAGGGASASGGAGGGASPRRGAGFTSGRRGEPSSTAGPTPRPSGETAETTEEEEEEDASEDEG